MLLESLLLEELLFYLSEPWGLRSFSILSISPYQVEKSGIYFFLSFWHIFSNITFDARFVLLQDPVQQVFTFLFLVLHVLAIDEVHPELVKLVRRILLHSSNQVIV